MVFRIVAIIGLICSPFEVSAGEILGARTALEAIKTGAIQSEETRRSQKYQQNVTEFIKIRGELTTEQQAKQWLALSSEWMELYQMEGQTKNLGYDAYMQQLNEPSDWDHLLSALPPPPTWKTLKTEILKREIPDNLRGETAAHALRFLVMRLTRMDKEHAEDARKFKQRIDLDPQARLVSSVKDAF